MRFKIGATSTWSFDWEKEQDKLLKAYPCLKDFGYEVETRTINTKRTLGDTQRTYRVAFVTINSLEELLRFKKAVETEIIISDLSKDEPEIEIYDDWRE